MQRGPREREARYVHFTLQRPGDLIYIQHLHAHAISTLDTGSPTISYERDVATTTSQLIIIQFLDEYTFGVPRDKWREIFRKNRFISITRQVGVFSFNRLPGNQGQATKTLEILGTALFFILVSKYRKRGSL